MLLLLFYQAATLQDGEDPEADHAIVTKARMLFRSLDRYDVGEIGRKELNDCILGKHALTVSPHEARLLVERLDAEDLERVGPDEFVHMVVDLSSEKIWQSETKSLPWLIRRIHDEAIGFAMCAHTWWISPTSRPWVECGGRCADIFLLFLSSHYD